MKSAITLKINGELFELLVEPKRTLLDALRDDLGMTGTKKGCDQGDCGACTVLLDGKAVNSCLILAVEAVGHEITTIEGLAKEGVLHPLQEAFIKLGAMQCGYCTPGMLLSAKALLDKNPHPAREDIKIAIAGNLCRCTGYVKIIDAILEAS
jgi:carbon-monoxide dehydrogenase small subunit